MSLTLAFLGDFGGAVDFIFHERDSVSGGVQIGGLGEIGDFAGEHLKVSAVAMAAACAVSIPIGLYLGHRGKGEFAAVTVSNVGRAVPAVVLLYFFIAYLGIGFTNVAAVLFLLAVPPILTNTYVGVRQIDPEVVDAAHGLGMNDMQVVRRVRLPLAMPTIVAGIPGQFPRINATKLFETDRINVWDQVWLPDQTIPNHLHYNQTVAVFLVGGKLLTRDLGKPSNP